MADKIIGVDSTGTELLTNAMKTLLNQHPSTDEPIRFEQLSEDGGIAFSADNGALITSEKISVTGKVSQKCTYPFYIVYRVSGTAERQKMAAQTFLDGIGRWLCGELPDKPALPQLSGGREIKRITRANSYGVAPNSNHVQDWLLPITVQYTNEFYR